MNDAVITLNGLEKRFPGMDKPAVAPLDCTIHAGYVTGLVGPDGAGKTTLMRMLAGLLKPDSGSATVIGFDPIKNDGALPVKPGRIALYGAGASRTVKGGTGSGEVNERHAVTILEGLELAGYEIASYGWIRDFEAECREAEERWRQERGAQGAGLMNSMVQPFMPPAGRVITDADIAASACDTAIYVVARQAGEGADKKLKNGEFDLSPAETESILKMAAGYKNSVLVVNSGSYMDIGTLDEAVSAVVWFCQQGMEGGAALADILSGRASPSGKLTDTWARRYADVPCAMQYSFVWSEWCASSQAVYCPFDMGS